MLSIFLYGKRRSGKTTIINTLLKELGLKPSGFRTICGPPGAGGDWDLYIAGAGEGEQPQLKTKVASCHSDGSWQSYSDVFDDAGVKLLTFGSKPQIVVMDELGFMEANALRFQRRVREVLDEGHPVLGVVKPVRNDFLNNILEHPGVTAIEVTEGNRGDVLRRLREVFGSLS